VLNLTLVIPCILDIRARAGLVLERVQTGLGSSLIDLLLLERVERLIENRVDLLEDFALAVR